MIIRGLTLSLLIVTYMVSSARADDVTDEINQALNAYNRKDLPNAMAGLQAALDLLRQNRADTFGAMLPNPPPGWIADRVETVSLGVAMAGGGTGATRRYRRGADTVTVSILTDSPMLQAMSALASSGMTAMRGARTQIVNGRRAVYSKDDDTFTVIVADRILVRVEGRNQPEDTLKQFLTAMDFDAVERAGR
jgi:hypothetical protein